MKKSKTIIFAVFPIMLVFCAACQADTFTHRKTGRTLHGYAIGQVENNTTAIATQEQGVVKLNLAEWTISADRLGRNNKVIILTLDSSISREIETTALQKSIVDSSCEGPLFIVLEIDTPGGNIDLVKRICSTVTATKNCQVIAFVNGGRYGGAISAGAAAALACDKIYMAPNSAIGAAALVAGRGHGHRELERVYGKTLSDKLSSAWRAYLASLAEQNGRPALLAKAMTDKGIEALEVREAEHRFFIEPANKKPGHKLVRTWSRKGSVLTLTASEAVQCGIADVVVDSRRQLLADMDAADAEIVINTAVQKAAKEFRLVNLKYNKLTKSLDLKYKEFQGKKPRPRILKILRGMKTDYQALIKLAKRYPDLGMSVRSLEEDLNSVEAVYKDIKMGADYGNLKWKKR